MAPNAIEHQRPHNTYQGDLFGRGGGARPKQLHQGRLKRATQERLHPTIERVVVGNVGAYLRAPERALQRTSLIRDLLAGARIFRERNIDIVVSLCERVMARLREGCGIVVDIFGEKPLGPRKHRQRGHADARSRHMWTRLRIDRRLVQLTQARSPHNSELKRLARHMTARCFTGRIPRAPHRNNLSRKHPKHKKTRHPRNVRYRTTPCLDMMERKWSNHVAKT